jgi:hypothetical protein
VKIDEERRTNVDEVGERHPESPEDVARVDVERQADEEGVGGRAPSNEGIHGCKMGAAEETPPRISGQEEQEARPKDIFFGFFCTQINSRLIQRTEQTADEVEGHEADSQGLLLRSLDGRRWPIPAAGASRAVLSQSSNDPARCGRSGPIQAAAGSRPRAGPRPGADLGRRWPRRAKTEIVARKKEADGGREKEDLRGQPATARIQDRDQERWKNHGRVARPKKLALNLGFDTML